MTDHPQDDSTLAALAALRALDEAEEQVTIARGERDRAVADMHYKAGMTVPDISRALELSRSNVRLIIKTNAPARR